ncbi:MAG TPA: riboflavin synthase [Arcobacter sp.]|jgi:riboflavin synthase|nr:riboflavin synthase [Arcobacter sp.]
MFTGLIREMAKVESFVGSTLTLKAQYKPKIGDSIAINGACLTVVSVTENAFSVELSPESQAHLALENYKNKVHMEPAMMMGDRFEGHIVQGHIDSIGIIKSIKNNGNSWDFFVEIPNQFIKFMIPKGSVTIDGVSLTINDVYKSKNQFRLTIIPHTVDNTLFKEYKINSRVNIETDMFARYVYNIFANKNDLSWDQVDSIIARY